jgi:hypothetical protein
MKLTKSTLAQLIKQQCDLDLPIDKIVKMMFKSFVSDSSHFNLTYKGNSLLKYAKFQSYKIKLNKPITMRAMLNLDRSCPAPYYLPQKRQYVTLYAEKPAVVLQLLDGDLDSFST